VEYAIIRLFEEAPDRGGYYEHEITREFIYEREDVFLIPTFLSMRQIRNHYFIMNQLKS